MRWYHEKRNTEYCPTINLDKLLTLVDDKFIAAAKAAKGTGKAPVIDLVKAGYFKLLGNGKFPELPVVVKARYFSRGVYIINFI